MTACPGANTGPVVRTPGESGKALPGGVRGQEPPTVNPENTSLAAEVRILLRIRKIMANPAILSLLP